MFIEIVVFRSLETSHHWICWHIIIDRHLIQVPRWRRLHWWGRCIFWTRNRWVLPLLSVCCRWRSNTSANERVWAPYDIDYSVFHILALSGDCSCAFSVSTLVLITGKKEAEKDRDAYPCCRCPDLPRRWGEGAGSRAAADYSECSRTKRRRERDVEARSLPRRNDHRHTGGLRAFALCSRLPRMASWCDFYACCYHSFHPHPPSVQAKSIFCSLLK